MSEPAYNVLGLIPATSDFSLELAVDFFHKRKFGKSRLESELAIAPLKRKPSGFRVFFGEWAIVAWLEMEPSVLVDNREFATGNDLPAPAEVIAACRHRLSIWSDDDPGYDYSNQFLIYTEDLRERFGIFIWDNVNGCWWT